MPMKVSEQQFLAQETTASEVFRRRLYDEASEAYPEYSESKKYEIFIDCMAFADRSSITTEHGLTSLVFVSFAYGSCIASDSAFSQAQALALATTGNPEAVVCALYEAL